MIVVLVAFALILILSVIETAVMRQENKTLDSKMELR